MKVLIQRVIKASVSVDNEEVAAIGSGLLLFTCLELGDTAETIEKAAYKIANLRIFEDEQDRRMKYNLAQIKGEILNVSQFTLSWDGQGGHRPSFDKSMPPQEAKVLLRLFNRCLEQKYGLHAKEGRFGANMTVSLLNDGPVTFMLDF